MSEKVIRLGDATDLTMKQLKAYVYQLNYRHLFALLLPN